MLQMNLYTDHATGKGSLAKTEVDRKWTQTVSVTVNFDEMLAFLCMNIYMWMCAHTEQIMGLSHITDSIFSGGHCWQNVHSAFRPFYTGAAIATEKNQEFFVFVPRNIIPKNHYRVPWKLSDLFDSISYSKNENLSRCFKRNWDDGHQNHAASILTEGDLQPNYRSEKQLQSRATR